MLVCLALFLLLGIYWIYLLAKRGDAGANRYGDPV
jgi:cbb3-type cytochrome oxidase subunit 3